ncbi:MAG: sigma-70 family RNA polymerase sigma factor [Planctomycetota bacterium]
MVETDLYEINDVTEEKVIIERSQQGNANAFSEIVKRYHDRLYNTIYRLVNAPDDALDICQEVFLKSFQNIKDFRGDASLLTYLYRIAFNECVAYRHKRQRIKNNLEQRAKSVENCERNIPSLNLQAKEREEYIQEVLNSLEPELKEVIILKDIEGFSYEEVSKALKISISTVRTNLEKARQVLRMKLKNLL